MSIRRAVIQNEENELPFHMSNIPEFFQRKCELELNESPERKKQSIQDLGNLLKNDKATKDICLHEDFLVQYLRHSKYNTYKAFNHLRNFIIFRHKEGKMFETIPDELLSLKSTKIFIILPKRTPDGCTLVLVQMGNWYPSELPFEYFKSLILITFLQLLRDPMTQINGIKLLYDFHGTRFEQFKYATPRNLYLFYHIALCCIPGRYKEVHILNQNPGFKLLWSILKAFVSDKIKDRMFFHSEINEILDYFPKSVIPVEYGGELVDTYATNFLQAANTEQKKYTSAGQPNLF